MWTTWFEIIIPLIIAALIGALFMRWWMKRWYEDVTETYETLQVKSQSGDPKNILTKDDLDNRLASISSSVASIPRTNLDPLTSRLSKIESSVAGMSFPETDLTPVYERMTRIDQRLAQPNKDFEKVDERLERLEASVSGLFSGDFDKLDERLANLEAMMSGMSDDVSTLHNADLEPLQVRLGRIERSIETMDISAPKVDLDPLKVSLADLENSVSEIDLPQTDLSPIQEQLTGLELRVVDLAEAIQEARGEEYASLRTEFGSLSSSFANLSLPSLDPVEQRLSSVERAVGGIQIPETDLAPLHMRLERLEQRLQDSSGDYQSLFAHLAGMEAAIDALNRDPVDLSPLQTRLSALESMISTVRADVRGIPSLDPVERQLASLQQMILSIPQPDLAPVVTSVRAVESRIDMAAMENRLTAIEYGLTAVHHMLRSKQNGPAPVSRIEPELYADSAKPMTNTKVTTQSFTTQSAPQVQTVTTRSYTSGADPLASARRPNDESNLLQSAAFGEADDLERISGVGPMLSDMLKDIGVYYFWQVAEWDAKDIVWVDNKLEHFKGRIERDNWVGQARQFAAELGTANRPG